jgi:hypothetical protein
MGARDSLETDTRVVHAPDVAREIDETEDAVESPRGEVLDDPERRREESAESRQRVDGNRKSDRFEVNREELGRFDLKRAGLPDMSIESAAKYIDENRASRPWLAMTDRACPEARRIIAAMDAAGGHAHIRHEGWVSEEANRRRVAYREDPAQLDPEKRALCIDGLRPNDKRHRCADIATRIADPDAFATAFTRGVEHSEVRKALDMAFKPNDWPAIVEIPIADLLGPDGHVHCTGWRLKPVDGSITTAYEKRNTWVVDRLEGRKPAPCEPEALPVRTFEGGVFTFIFIGNETERRYEIMTMCPDPPEDQRRES